MTASFRPYTALCSGAFCLAFSSWSTTLLGMAKGILSGPRTRTSVHVLLLFLVQTPRHWCLTCHLLGFMSASFLLCIMLHPHFFHFFSPEFASPDLFLIYCCAFAVMNTDISINGERLLRDLLFLNTLGDFTDVFVIPGSQRRVILVFTNCKTVLR